MPVTRLEPAAAARHLLAGEIVICPTEAVYGLSCDPWNEDAVSRLLALKQRAESKGLILAAGGLYQVTSLVKQLDSSQKKQLMESWPGPVTWLIPAPADFPKWITGGSDRLALRVTAHPALAALCREAGKPLVTTSANPSGQPASKSLDEVCAWFPDLSVVEGELGGRNNPTEIRDLLSGKIIRTDTNQDNHG